MPSFSLAERELDRGSSRVAARATSTQLAELSPEALSGGAVEEEVDGVVGVHHQLGGGQSQAHVARRHRGRRRPSVVRRPHKMLD